MTTLTPTSAFIFDAVRTPRGKGKNGSLHGVKPVELGATVLRALAARNQLDTSAVDDVVFGVVSVALAGYFVGYLAPRSGLLILFAVAVVLLIAEREAARRVFVQLRKRGRLVRSVIVVGANAEGREIAAMLVTEPWLGYRVLGFVDDESADPSPVAGIPLLGKVGDLTTLVRQHPGASVIVASSGRCAAILSSRPPSVSPTISSSRCCGRRKPTSAIVATNAIR